MKLILVFLILIFNRVYSTSFIVLRHIRLPTNDEQYHIRCPYNLNYLTLQLLNYSNENCFNLYSTSNNNACKNHQSSCQFHAKPVQLHCHYHSYSKYVNITYQCSSKSTISSLTLRTHSFLTNSLNPEETIALFLIALCLVISLWICICCIWFTHYHNNDNENDELLSYRSYSNDDIIDFKNNLCLHDNLFENNHISLLRTVQTI